MEAVADAFFDERCPDSGSLLWRTTSNHSNGLFCAVELIRSIESVSAAPEPSAIDRIREMRWIHVPIVLAIAGTGIAISLALQKQNTELFLPAILLHITSIPYMLLALWGLHVRTPALPSAELRKLDRLILCVVTKGKNVDVLLRTYRMLEPLCGNGVELCVVTDHPLPVPHLLVPPEFQTRHARYKARALEYFRQQQRFGPGDWVLHLDEESVVDSRTVAACQDYCRRSPYIYGQGLILYNNYEFWRHPLQTAADCIRVADDLGKFHLQLARIHWPIFGLHGSFLLVKGSLGGPLCIELVRNFR